MHLSRSPPSDSKDSRKARSHTTLMRAGSAATTRRVAGRPSRRCATSTRARSGRSTVFGTRSAPTTEHGPGEATHRGVEASSSPAEHRPGRSSPRVTAGTQDLGAQDLGVLPAEPSRSRDRRSRRREWDRETTVVASSDNRSPDAAAYICCRLSGGAVPGPDHGVGSSTNRGKERPCAYPLTSGQSRDWQKRTGTYAEDQSSYGKCR